MRKILVKFSDERNRKYSIRTVIAEDENTEQKFVFKENIYPEGAEHIRNIMLYSQLLSRAYPEVEICPVEMTGDNTLKFDYIAGNSLEDEYRDCVIRNQTQELEEILLKHKEIILGKKENACEFSMTPQFKEIFGMNIWEGNTKALRITNFDATAGNIIYRENIPVFIDYEWVYDFPIPQDLAVYHCIRDIYLHVEEMEKFYPLKKAMKFLNVDSDIDMMEKAYKNFYRYVSVDKDGMSYGLSKMLNLKGTIDQGNGELQRARDACAFAEKNWKEACQANAVLSQQIELWKKKYEQEVQNHQIHAKQIEDAVQEQARQSETWRIAYETVINSRTWRLSKKLKRLIGKK